MPLFNSDQDYLDAGVAPPEHNPHGVPGDDNADLSNMIAAVGKHKHEWKQLGNMIECTAGRHPHGHGFDHLNKLLIGTDDSGKPIFKTLDNKH